MAMFNSYVCLPEGPPVSIGSSWPLPQWLGQCPGQSSWDFVTIPWFSSVDGWKMPGKWIKGNQRSIIATLDEQTVVL